MLLDCLGRVILGGAVNEAPRTTPPLPQVCDV